MKTNRNGCSAGRSKIIFEAVLKTFAGIPYKSVKEIIDDFIILPAIIINDRTTDYGCSGK